MIEWLHFHFSLSCIGEGNGNPLQCSCLENPRDRGAWWVAVYGVAQSRTWLKQLSSSSKYITCKIFSPSLWFDFYSLTNAFQRADKLNLISPLYIFFFHVPCLWKWKLLSHVLLCSPIDWNLIGASVHGILQARILEWIANSFSKRSSWPRDWTWVSCMAGRLFTVRATKEHTMPLVLLLRNLCLVKDHSEILLCVFYTCMVWVL